MQFSFEKEDFIFFDKTWTDNNSHSEINLVSVIDYDMDPHAGLYWKYYCSIVCKDRIT